MNTFQSGRLRKARIGLILDEPFFGALIMNLKEEETQAVPTFSTDGARLFYNPKFCASLSDAEVKGVLAHEVLHCALGHIFRRGHRDPVRFNQAADYAINNYLTEYNEAAKKAGRAEPFPLPAGALIDATYKDLSAEEIYNRLPSPPPGGGKGNGKGGGKGSGAPQSGPGEFTDAPGDESEQAAQESQWKINVQNAATCAKSAGKLPAGLARLVGELLNPQVKWTQVLRDLLTTLCRDDYTWTRPNVRYLAAGFILPTLRNERMGRIAVAIDTSGSIGERELTEFLTELQSISDECRPERITVMQADAAVLAVDEFEPGDEIKIEMKGGGGTDFRPVFTRLGKDDEPPAALVYLTDAEGSFPDVPPSWPVVWAVKGNGEVPFGERVQLN